jgi:hypothetical protein
VTLLEAGRATLELADPRQAEFIDEVEVGRRVAGHVRNDRLLAVVGPDTHPPTEDNATVMELARGGADLGLRVCLPAPARLQDVVADHRSGQAHLVRRAKLIGHHGLGLTQIADFEPADRRPLGRSTRS